MDNEKLLAHPNYRYIATVIDGTIIFLLNLPIMYLITLFDDQEALFTLVLIFMYQAVVYFIFDVLIPTCTKGQTIGRMIIGLRLIKNDYTHATFTNFIRRASIFIVIAFISEVLLYTTAAYIFWVIVFVLSIYWLYKDDLRRTTHDRIAGTLVVYDKEFNKGTE